MTNVGSFTEPVAPELITATRDQNRTGLDLSHGAARSPHDVGGSFNLLAQSSVSEQRSRDFEPVNKRLTDISITTPRALRSPAEGAIATFATAIHSSIATTNANGITEQRESARQLPQAAGPTSAAEREHLPNGPARAVTVEPTRLSNGSGLTGPVREDRAKPCTASPSDYAYIRPGDLSPTYRRSNAPAATPGHRSPVRRTESPPTGRSGRRCRR